MPYVRKTRDIYVVQQDFGAGDGWEDVSAATNRKEARDDLKSYRENQPQYPVRIIKRREKIEMPSDKPELQQRLQSVPELNLEDNDFAYHATDLYVVSKPGVVNWLKNNYEYWPNVTQFVSQEGSNWNGAGKICLDIPFAGKWPSPK